MFAVACIMVLKRLVLILHSFTCNGAAVMVKSISFVELASYNFSLHEEHPNVKF